MRTLVFILSGIMSFCASAYPEKPAGVTYKKSYIWLEEAPQKGASFGCSLVLIDSDRGAGTRRMIWGADLSETASGCGVVTLLP